MNCHITFVYDGEVQEMRVRELSLAVILAARHYKVLVHTNLGSVLSKLGLPCEIVPTGIPSSERFWVERKLRTFLLSGSSPGPFVHIDHDVFLIDPLPKRLTDSPLFAQSDEPSSYYRKLPGMPRAWLSKYVGPLNPFRAFNMGVFGGKNGRVAEFARHALAAAAEAPLDTPATYIEQATLGRFRDVATLFRFGDKPPKGYVHLMQSKGDPSVQRRIAERLAREKTSAPPPPPPAPTTAVDSETPCFVELGRYGDIINLLPVLEDVARTRKRPVALIVSDQFADLLEGVSYVVPIPMRLETADIQPAIKEARARFSNVIVSQVYANGWNPGKHCPSYNMDSWRLSGYLDRWADPDLKLNFDRRDYRRERSLIGKVWPTDGRPVVLVNLQAGHSSPFAQWEACQRELMARWGETIAFVEIGKLRAGRIFDLVGLMELADGLVTIDTATLHLAAATSVDTIALLSAIGPWNQSTPRCRCPLAFPCDQWQTRIGDIHETILAMTKRPRIIHAFDRRGTQNPRIERAQASWRALDWVGAPYSEARYKRSAKDLGDARALPYLKDVLANALEHAEDRDYIVFTNDDITLTRETDREVRRLLAKAVMVTGRRTEIGGDRKTHPGRDLVAFRAGWLRMNMRSVPDFLLGASMWDLWAAARARQLCGIATADGARRLIGVIVDKGSPMLDSPACEMPRGTVQHEPHVGTWTLDEASPSEAHNRKAFARWRENPENIS